MRTIFTTQAIAPCVPVFKASVLRSALVVFLPLISVVVLPACTWLQPYKIDVQQGSPITQAQVAKLKLGMNQQQVKYIVGSPLIIDPLRPNIWQYNYAFKAGTDSKKTGIKSIHNQQLALTFDANSELSVIEGANNVPASYPILPVSRLSDAQALIK